jgi:hypothetical protein
MRSRSDPGQEFAQHREISFWLIPAHSMASADKTFIPQHSGHRRRRDIVRISDRRYWIQIACKHERGATQLGETLPKVESNAFAVSTEKVVQHGGVEG